MESTRVAPKRRAVSMQTSISKHQGFPADTSPSPQTSSLTPVRGGTEEPRPVSRSRLVSVDWQEEQESHTSRLQIELEECVETKTVTTTTTTKRSYPPLQIQRPSLANLDAKEYPLASRDLPAQLQNFSYALDGQVARYPNSRGSRRAVWSFSYILGYMCTKTMLGFLFTFLWKERGSIEYTQILQKSHT